MILPEDEILEVDYTPGKAILNATPPSWRELKKTNRNDDLLMAKIVSALMATSEFIVAIRFNRTFFQIEIAIPFAGIDLVKLREDAVLAAEALLRSGVN